MTLIVVTKQTTLTFNADKIMASSTAGVMYFTAQNIHGELYELLGVNITELIYFKYEQ